ncbi:anti-sigma factor family protein [Salisediminibacterium beveridgei]|uniref:Anti-sigma-W factor RsiW n=1 Tax=Salisediminibacterium beveridgei TaxID=632773 RepID=A0A1D7QZ47_9BACI|nr:zf-HC2 domain-containing protein [Salisediminibacterium beveridgei]AOM84293.1 Anti-sigma-W factor rsiW [Salisediminibacterium beveridgei]
MACRKEQSQSIHRYLDEEMDLLEQRQFEEHVRGCESCDKHLSELRRTVAIVQSTSHFKAPDQLTDAVMGSLPKQKQTTRWRNWVREHPFVITAATFFLVFMISLSAGFGGEDQQIAVTGDGQFFIDDERGVVVVPEGEVIQGDLEIRNGNVEVLGEVSGNITVINGEHLMASAGHVAGEVQEVNRFYNWLWHEMKDLFSQVIPMERDKDGTE